MFQVINGVVYDFRCYFCKNLPRVGSANRSELYRHYSVYHYSNEIKAEFGGSGGILMETFSQNILKINAFRQMQSL